MNAVLESWAHLECCRYSPASALICLRVLQVGCIIAVDGHSTPVVEIRPPRRSQVAVANDAPVGGIVLTRVVPCSRGLMLLFSDCLPCSGMGALKSSERVQGCRSETIQ